MPHTAEEREAERARADRMARSIFYPAYPGYAAVVKRDQLAAHLALRPSKKKEKAAKRQGLKAAGMSPSSSDDESGSDDRGYRKIKYKDFAQALYKEERRLARNAERAAIQREKDELDAASARAFSDRTVRLGLYQERERAAEPRLLSLASEEMYIRGGEPARIAPALAQESQRTLRK